MGYNKCALSQDIQLIWNLAWNAVSNCILASYTFSSVQMDLRLPLGAWHHKYKKHYRIHLKITFGYSGWLKCSLRGLLSGNLFGLMLQILCCALFAYFSFCPREECSLGKQKLGLEYVSSQSLEIRARPRFCGYSERASEDNGRIFSIWIMSQG